MNKLLTPSSTKAYHLFIAARNSPLSQVQVQEVYELLKKKYDHITIEPIFTETTGDKDQKTSLRALDKTDFFTKEVDNLLLNGACDISVHSAKDLPARLPDDLMIIAITEGVDKTDSLVIRTGETIDSLKTGAKIATSSERREEMVRELRGDFTFVDIRGTIGQRLAKLTNGEVDGVVIAEAALIRLKLSRLNRITLPGDTTPGQGQLAILAKKEDKIMEQLFAPFDHRKSSLYLGLDLPKGDHFEKLTHFPIIQITPKELDTLPQNPFEKLTTFSHAIFTSKSAVRIIFDYYRISPSDFSTMTVIAVGQKTAVELKKYGIDKVIVATNETSEGVVEVLDELDLTNASVLWPHSALSRSVITDYLKMRSVFYVEVAIYNTTVTTQPSIPLDDFDKIIFTSPSTVYGFKEIYGEVPEGLEYCCIGPVTKDAFAQQFPQSVVLG